MTSSARNAPANSTGGADRPERARPADRATAFEAVASALSAATTIEEIGRIALEEIRSAFGAESGALTVLEGDELRVVATDIRLPIMAEYMRIPLANAIPATEVVRRAAPIFVSSQEELFARYPHVREAMQSGQRAWAAVPLVVEGRAVGSAWWAFAQERTFSAEDERFMMTIARQAAQAVVRAQLFESERRVRERASRLEAVARSLSAASSVREGATVAVEQIASALGASGGGLGVLDATGRTLRIVIRRGAEHGEPEIPLDAELPVTQAVRTRRPVVVESREAIAERYPAIAPRADPRFAAWAAVPLLVEERAVGGAWFLFEKPRRFTEEEQALIMTIGHQTAQALARMQLYDAEREARARAERVAFRTSQLARIGAALSGVMSGEEVARILLDDGRIALEAQTLTLWTLTPEGTAIQAVRRAGELSVPLRQTHRIELTDELPAALAVRTWKEAWMPSWKQHLERHPALRARYGGDEGADFSCAAVPVVRNGHVYGALALMFPSPRALDEEERAFITLLAQHAGQAMDRARLFKELEESAAEARVAVELAMAAERRKDEFLAMLGHELRNPLAPIRTALELLRMRGGLVQREHAVIDRQVGHLERLVDDLLDISRITRGEVNLKPEALEIGTAVTRALELASPLLDKKKHRVHVDVAREGLVVRADPFRLAQVLSNILINAAQYTEPQGSIAVSARSEGDEVVVRVRDSGMGISADLLPRVFDLFVQGPRSLARSEGGLGLGLAIVRRIVEAHGGSVSAHSEGPGRGSEFTVRLRHERPAASASGASSTDGAARKPSRRVLVVDDNVDAVEVLAEALQLMGCEVAVAHDGPQALRTSQEFKPDVAVLDLGLPVMDGFELARRLREQHGEGLELVAVSGYGQDADRRRTTEAGFAQHLVKPVDLDVLAAAIGSLQPL